jgi:hypothetical protein
MPNRMPHAGGTADHNPNILLAPLSLGMWNPFLAGTSRGNSQAHEGFGAIVSEWQEFLSRRLKEDAVLMQRLSQSSTPDQILAVYIDYWQKATEDFGHQVTIMSKLATSVTTNMVTAAQSSDRRGTHERVPSMENSVRKLCGKRATRPVRRTARTQGRGRSPTERHAVQRTRT